MKKCEWCGNEFDVEEAEDIFEDELLWLSYTGFQVLIFATVYSGIKFATTTIYNVIFQKLETGG